MHENDGPSFHSNYPGLHGMALFFFSFFFLFSLSDSLQLCLISPVSALSLSPAVARSPQDGWFVGNIHHMRLVTIMIMLVMAYFFLSNNTKGISFTHPCSSPLPKGVSADLKLLIKMDSGVH